jgi:TonB-dependent receptor
MGKPMKIIQSKKIIAAQIVAANMLIIGAAAANVANAEEKVMEEVVVEGFRGSLQAALATKRDESGVVDAIMAEDIADFPDLNLAESIQRIPGVSINRVNGEGKQVTVRGLSGDFNRIRINGMEAMNTTGSSDASGGANRGRGFDFNTFASDLFNQIVVRKSSSANVEEGSLGATVDLRTSRPFDYDEGLTTAVSGQLSSNSLTSETVPRFAGLVSYSNADKSFGALLSLAYSTRNIREEGFSTVRFQDGTFNSVGGVSCASNPTDAGCLATDKNSENFHPRIPRFGRLSHEQDRLGLTASLQFAPSESTTVSIDGLYSTFDANRDEEYLEVFLRSQEKYIDISSYTLDASKNLIDSATMDIPGLSNGTHPIRSEHRFDELNTEFKQLTFQIEHEFNEKLRGNLFAGSSSSTMDNPRQTTILADAVADVTGFSYDFRQDPKVAMMDFGSLDVTDATQFAFTEFRDRPQSVENTFKTFQADLEYDLSETMVLKGGVSYKEFGYDYLEKRRENTYGSLVCANNLYECDLDGDGTDDIRGIPLTGDLIGSVTGFGDGLSSGVTTSWVSPNVDAAVAMINGYSIPGKVNGFQQVTEKDQGAWAQVDFTTQMGSVPVRGDFGVRYVETETTATGLVSGEEVTMTRSYNDFLPSLNLAFEVSEDVIVRAAAAKVMARPSLGNLTPGGSLDSFSGEPYTYKAGNPGLLPYRATSYDLGVEWYFQDEALLSAGYFVKDVSSFFTRSGVVETTYSQSGLPASLAPASSPLYNDLAAGLDPAVEISQVQNGGDAKLDGFEIIYQQPFTALPGIWSNFGFTGNYTSVDSKEIIGFSPNSYNATLYYEDDVFSARVSAAYRDAYVTTAAKSTGREERGYASTTNIDFSASYKLNEDTDLTFEALNLTDDFEFQVFDAANLTNVYHHTGTTYMLGFRWSH